MRRSYDTDLIDEQWTKISSLYPEANHRGRPRTIDFRETPISYNFPGNSRFFVGKI